MGINILQNLPTSPQVEIKINPQRVDMGHGNYLIYNQFGPNENLCHKHFKALFPYQTPLVEPQPITKKSQIGR